MSNNGHETAIAVLEPAGRAIATPRLTADLQGVKLMVDQVRELQATVLRPQIDFGVIPGTGDKPCLLKPGAESLLAAFNLSVGQPNIEIIPIEHDVPGHREYRLELPIVNRASGMIVGYGTGSCSTLESKYRFRNAQRTCPNCGKAAINRSKPEYGGGWYCWKKKDGCGAEFQANDPAIVNQVVGQLENPNPADQYNTVLKMAKKRALVDGALTTTAASGVFTQDVEEQQDGGYDEPYAPPPSNGNGNGRPQNANGNGHANGNSNGRPAPAAAAKPVEVQLLKFVVVNVQPHPSMDAIQIEGEFCWLIVAPAQEVIPGHFVQATAVPLNKEAANGKQIYVVDPKRHAGTLFEVSDLGPPLDTDPADGPPIDMSEAPASYHH